MPGVSGSGQPTVQRSARTPGGRAVLCPSEFKVHGIDLYIETGCNRRCTYCFLSDAYLGSKVRMSVEVVRDITAWAEKSSSIREVTLLGGEPALHPHFSSIVHLIAERSLAVRVVTNGSRAMREALTHEEIASRLSRVALSLDSVDANAFDRIRGRGAFRDAQETIEILQRRSIAFDINITVLRSTAPDLVQTLRFAERIGAKRANVHWYSAVGRGRIHALEESLAPHEWRRVLDDLASYKGSTDEFTIDCELGFALGHPGENRKMCAVRDGTNLQFLPSGAVFSCGVLVEHDALSGYVWEGGELVERGNRDDELAIAAGMADGCPVRRRWGDTAEVPLCIYNRLAN